MKVQLGYYTIRAPIGGRTGSVGLKQGALVKGNDSGSTLVTINQMDPIDVAFSVPQQTLGELRASQHGGPVAVDVTAPGAAPVRGQLSFIDNNVDSSSGTISVKAATPNADEKLWPGQFVNVTVTLRTDNQALVTPTQSVQIGQAGTYVYVVKPDKTVEMRPVQVAWASGDETVIANGLQVDEQVVVDGQLRITRGSHVDPRPAGVAPAAGVAANTP